MKIITKHMKRPVISLVSFSILILILSLNAVLDVSAAGTVSNCTDYSAPGGLQQALSGGGTITFSCSGTIIVPQINISGNYTLDGSGQQVTLSGNNANRVFYVNPGSILNIMSLTIADGNVGSGRGGGIYNLGTINIEGSTLVNNNTNSSGRGGGIYNSNSTANIANSTFSASYSARGGGIYVNGGTTKISNSTFSGNSGDGGGIYHNYGTTMLKNSIVTNSGFNDCSGPGANFSGVNNLGNCPGNVGTVTNFDTNLVDNGGATKTYALQSGSNAIDAVSDCTYVSSGSNPLFSNGGANLSDQRAVARPLDGDGDDTSACDIGAYEIITNVWVDDDYDEPGCTADGHNWQIDCFDRVQDGIDAVESSTVFVAAGTYLVSNYHIDKDVDVVGAGPDVTIVQAGSTPYADLTPFFIDAGTTVSIQGMTIRHAGSPNDGGGIFNEGRLSLSNCVVTLNSAADGAGIYSLGDLSVSNCTISENWGNDGAGIAINPGVTANITSSTISNNRGSSGAGISVVEAQLTLENSTVSGNWDGTWGGGLYIGENATAMITNTTFSENEADFGGGVYVRSHGLDLGSATIVNSTFYGNIGGDSAIYGYDDTKLKVKNSLFANLGVFSSCAVGVGSDSLASNNTCSGATVDPSADDLGPLADNGGGTMTHALTPSNAAIDFVSADQAACPGSDQRGIPRTDGACDVGAYEVEWDFGDAPDPDYQTLLSSDGARHIINPSLYMGTSIDKEGDGQPNGTATGDDTNGIDDEDGVAFAGPLVQCGDVTVTVTSSLSAKLDAWIDFNDNGSWADAGEQIFSSQSLGTGKNELSVKVPCDSQPAKLTFARFRLSSLGSLSFDGASDDGEVEDYALEIKERMVMTFYSIGREDGQIYERNEDSGEGGSVNSKGKVMRVGDDSSDKQIRSVLSFNTSTLPDDAIVFSGTLSVREHRISGAPYGTLGSLLVDARSKRFGRYARLEAVDFNAKANLMPAFELYSVVKSPWLSADLTPASFGFLNLNGRTQYRLRFELDDNDNNYADYVSFYTGNDKRKTNWPILEINYYLP